MMTHIYKKIIIIVIIFFWICMKRMLLKLQSCTFIPVDVDFVIKLQNAQNSGKQIKD